MLQEDRLEVSEEECRAFRRLRMLFQANYALVWEPDVSVEDWVGWFHHGAWPEDEVAWIRDALRVFVGLDVNHAELCEFLGYQIEEPIGERWSRESTVGALAVWVLDRCELVSMEPLELAGNTCDAGGVFLGMVEIVRRQTPDAPPFGPSTPLLDVVKPTAFFDFWTAVSVAANKRMPSLRAYGSYFAFLSVLVCLYALPLIVAWRVFDWLDSPWEWPLGFVCCFAWILFAMYGQNWMSLAVGEYFDRKKPPEWFLPPGIATFGDLARHLANAA